MSQHPRGGRLRCRKIQRLCPAEHHAVLLLDGHYRPQSRAAPKDRRSAGKEGYEVRVFDLINPDTSFCYNPFEYVHDDKDVLRLISNLIQNTTPKGSQSSDPFWEKSETALLQALMLYLLHEAPPEEQNFAMIMEMLGSAQVKEEDEDYESPLDILFDRLEMRDPDSIAVKQYHIYKQAAGVVSLKRLLNQSILKSWSSKMIKKSLEAYFLP